MRSKNTKRFVPIAATIICFNLFAVCSAAEKYSLVDIHPQSDSRTPVNRATEAKSGVTFLYPKAWEPKADSDPSVILGFAGLNAQSVFGEVKVIAFKGIKDVDSVKNIVVSQMSESAIAAKKSEEKRVRFGTNYQYTGPEVVLDMRVGEIPFRDRFIFFQDNDKNVYCMSFVCRASDFETMHPTFDSILASLSQTSASSAKNQSTHEQKEIWSLHTFTDKSGGISFGYPEGWKLVDNDPGKDFDVKFRGHNAKNLGAELFASRTERHPNYSLEQFAETYEQTYLRPLRDYKQVTHTRAPFGISHTEGHFNNCNFSADGLPGKQSSVIFSDNKHFYALALNTVGWTDAESRDLFERITASVKLSE